MVFANPVPRSLVTGEHYDRLGDSFYLHPDKLASDYATVRFERELRIFRRFCGQGSVLDVGCSTGGFLFQLKTRFPGAYQLRGMDVSQPALEHAASQGLKVMNTSLVDWQTTETFDAITFWAVLEHLADPETYWRRAVQRLKPGGHAFVLVPNLDSLAVRCLAGKYRYLMLEHVNYFDRNTLSHFLKNFPQTQLVYLSSRHFNPLVIWQDFRNPGGHVANEDRVKLLARTTAHKQNPWLRPVRWAYQGIEQILRPSFLADNLVAVVKKAGAGEPMDFVD